MKNYRIISAESEEHLETAVNLRLEDGTNRYFLVGGVSVTVESDGMYWFYQAIAMKE